MCIYISTMCVSNGWLYTHVYIHMCMRDWPWLRQSGGCLFAPLDAESTFCPGQGSWLADPAGILPQSRSWQKGGASLSSPDPRKWEPIPAVDYWACMVLFQFRSLFTAMWSKHFVRNGNEKVWSADFCVRSNVTRALQCMCVVMSWVDILHRRWA